jgi:hypothetical protein
MGLRPFLLLLESEFFVGEVRLRLFLPCSYGAAWLLLGGRGLGWGSFVDSS